MRMCGALMMPVHLCEVVTATPLQLCWPGSTARVGLE
jgi:hypothetical protein